MALESEKNTDQQNLHNQIKQKKVFRNECFIFIYKLYDYVHILMNCFLIDLYSLCSC